MQCITPSMFITTPKFLFTYISFMLYFSSNVDKLSVYRNALRRLTKIKYTEGDRCDKLSA